MKNKNKTINISLPHGLAELAEAQVKAGYYSSVSEVIREALRKILFTPSVPTFKMSEKAEKVALQAKRDYEAGRVTSFESFSELVE